MRNLVGIWVSVGIQLLPALLFMHIYVRSAMIGFAASFVGTVTEKNCAQWKPWKCRCVVSREIKSMSQDMA